jgi:hypothetical protein
VTTRTGVDCRCVLRMRGWEVGSTAQCFWNGRLTGRGIRGSPTAARGQPCTSLFCSSRRYQLPFEVTREGARARGCHEPDYLARDLRSWSSVVPTFVRPELDCEARWDAGPETSLRFRAVLISDTCENA